MARHRMDIPYGSASKTCPVRPLTRWLAEGQHRRPGLSRCSPEWENSSGALVFDSVAWPNRQTTRSGGSRKKPPLAKLEVGHATQASLNKVNPQAIVCQPGYRSSRPHRGYVRVLGILDENAAAGLVFTGEALLNISFLKHFGRRSAWHFHQIDGWPSAPPLNILKISLRPSSDAQACAPEATDA
ncbi:MAG: hypothetical protein P4L10_11440 [Acidobacteriaceae bacterium]|nr:hypothetical protein [Acidobacteriaceae bacterium]